MTLVHDEDNQVDREDLACVAKRSDVVHIDHHVDVPRGVDMRDVGHVDVSADGIKVIHVIHATDIKYLVHTKPLTHVVEVVQVDKMMLLTVKLVRGLGECSCTLLFLDTILRV